MSDQYPKFSKSDYLIQTRKKSFNGFLRVDTISLKHKLFLGDWSPEINRELLVREEAVGVLLFDPKRDEIVLVRQFRVGLVDKGVSPWILELVAGMVEVGEELVEVALREVREESNAEVSKLIKICDYFSSPGISSEKVRLYLGIVASEDMGGVYGLENENEDIEVVVMPYENAIKVMKKGCLANAMSIIALQWLELNKADILKTVLT